MQFAKSATGKASKGFTAEELAAMRERAQELKAAARRGPGASKADGENAVLEKIAAMPEPDGAIGERLHAIVKASAPALSPKLWLIVMSNARPPTATRTAHTECRRSIARWQPKLDTDAVRLLGSLALMHYGKAAAWAHRLCVEQPTTTNKQGKVTIRYPRGERPDSAGWHRAPARANLQGSGAGGVRRLDERGGAEALVACRVGVGDAGCRDGARVGGSLRLVMRSPDGEEFGGRGEYLEITPPERLVFTWTWGGHEGHEGTQLVEVEFNEHADGTTTVVLTNRGLRDEESERSHRDGWLASFDNLERVLAR